MPKPLERVDGFSGVLSRLESLWRGVDAPILDALQPGLASEQIDKLLRDAGFESSLPPVIRAWFAWHNGVAHGTPPHEGWVLAARYFNPLEMSLTAYADQRAFAQESFERGFAQSADEDYDHRWLPLFGTAKDHVFVACDGTGAVGCYNPEEPTRPNPTLTLTDLLDFWLEGATSGLYTWDPAAQVWQVDGGRVDESPKFRNLLF